MKKTLWKYSILSIQNRKYDLAA